MGNTFFNQALDKIFKEIKKEKSLKDKILESWLKNQAEYVHHAQPSSLSKGILYIDVEDSNWLYYCRLNKEEIKRKLKKFFNQGRIKDIRFRIKNERKV